MFVRQNVVHDSSCIFFIFYRNLISMNTFSRRFVSPAFAVCVVMMLAVVACGPSKQEKEKYHGSIKVVIDKAERNSAFVAKMMNLDTSADVVTQIANMTAAVEGLDKFDGDLKTAKSELAKIATPKFDDLGLKSSTDKWFDAQVKGVADLKAAFQEMIGIMKLAAEVNNEVQQGILDEAKTARLDQELAKMPAMDKRLRGIATTMHNAQNDVLTNEEKFIVQNSLTVEKFVLGEL